MKIKVNVDKELDDTEITINCTQMTPAIENMIALIRMANQQIAVTKDGENYLLDVSKILYIDVLLKQNYIL